MTVNYKTFFKLIRQKLDMVFYINKDYIIFVESFPVIPLKIMESMILYSTKLLSKKGKIIFIHNLLSDAS